MRTSSDCREARSRLCVGPLQRSLVRPARRLPALFVLIPAGMTEMTERSRLGRFRTSRSMLRAAFCVMRIKE